MSLDFIESKVAHNLHFHHFNTITDIAILLGASRDEVQQAIDFEQEQLDKAAASTFPLNGDNDDWTKYETGGENAQV